MLSEHRDNHRRIFRSLTLVNSRCVGWYQHVEFAKPVGYGSSVKAYNDLTSVRVYSVDVTYIAVVNLLLVVIFDLHHLVARSKGPAEPLDLSVTGGIQRCLQLDVQ